MWGKVTQTKHNHRAGLPNRLSQRQACSKIVLIFVNLKAFQKSGPTIAAFRTPFLEHNPQAPSSRPHLSHHHTPPHPTPPNPTPLHRTTSHHITSHCTSFKTPHIQCVLEAF